MTIVSISDAIFGLQEIACTIHQETKRGVLTRMIRAYVLRTELISSEIS